MATDNTTTGAAASTEEEKFDIKFDFDNELLRAEKLLSNASGYIINKGLRRAVEVAVMLKQPLLLTRRTRYRQIEACPKLATDLHEKSPDEYLSETVGIQH
ncbi:MAG: hypothetical protein WDO15_06250 [Bacteroidota bacterium]